MNHHHRSIFIGNPITSSQVKIQNDQENFEITKRTFFTFTTKLSWKILRTKKACLVAGEQIIIRNNSLMDFSWKKRKPLVLVLVVVIVASAREVKSQLFPDFFFWKILLLTILFFQGKIYLLLFPHRLMEKYACYYTDCTTVRTLNHLVGNQPRLSWKKEIYFQIVIIILLQQERYYWRLLYCNQYYVNQFVRLPREKEWDSSSLMHKTSIIIEWKIKQPTIQNLHSNLLKAFKCYF